MGVVIERFDVYLVQLDPTVGHEIKKTRPSLIISPDEMNQVGFGTVIVAPMTSTGRARPTRAACRFQGKNGLVLLDQVRTVDRSRLVKKLGRLSARSSEEVLGILAQMFAP